jgi:hypothetical protein
LLTKSNTVRFSGINNSRLSEIDTKFIITKQSETNNIFNLVSDKKEIIEENVELNTVSDIVEEPDDFDLSDLLDDEIHGLDFNLN